MDAIEVSPLRCVTGGSARASEEIVEVCDPLDAAFWSVYTHFRHGTVECVADFDLESEAWEYAETVLAGPRGLPIYSRAV